MPSFPVARLFVLCTLAVLSLIALGLAADLCVNGKVTLMVDVFPNNPDVPYLEPGLEVLSPTAKGMAVAIAVLTLVVVMPVLALARLLKDAQWKKFVNLVWVELSWTAVFSVLWLATAVLVTEFSITTDTDLMPMPELQIPCNSGPCAEGRALKAISWLNWIILLGYFVALATCSIITVKRGGPSVIRMDVNRVLEPHEEKA